MLGAISISSGSRNLETYIKDMEERGQSSERIQEVTAALKLLNEKFSSVHEKQLQIYFLLFFFFY